MMHVTAHFAFEPQGLFLGGFGEFMLKRVFLSTVAFLLTFMVAFSFGQGSSLSRLVKAYSMSLMSFAFWTVSPNLFRNIHVEHYPALQ
jgi:hypothetical protein